jgi:hypothetical protein
MNELFAKHLNDGTNVPNELLKKAIEDGFDKDDLLYRSVSFRSMMQRTLCPSPIMETLKTTSGTTRISPNSSLTA